MKKLILIGAIVSSFFTVNNCTAAHYCMYQVSKCDPGANGYDYVDAFNQGTVEHNYDRVTVRVMLCKNPGSLPCVDPNPPNFKLHYTDINSVEQQIDNEIQSGNLSGHTYYDGSTGSETVSSFDPTSSTTLPEACILWESTPSPNGGTCINYIIFEEIKE